MVEPRAQRRHLTVHPAACSTLCNALAARMMALLASPTAMPHCTAAALAQWLRMFAVCKCRHVECLEAIAAFLQSRPDRLFLTDAAMASSLWAFAKLLVPPGPLLDHCMLSAPELLSSYSLHPQVRPSSPHVLSPVIARSVRPARLRATRRAPITPEADQRCGYRWRAAWS